MKLALVTPWFGRELKGGAEQQAWQIAARLAARGHEIEVLTTCCRSHQDDWATNHWPAGVTREAEGFAIRRFAVDRRDRAAFDRVCGRLLSLSRDALQAGVAPVDVADSSIFVAELIKSAELLSFLEAQRESYDWFILLPYLYGPILEGVRIVGDRAALQPCLHDEAYAYLPEVTKAFHQAGRLLFNSEGEQELAARLFGPAVWEKSRLVGEGVEIKLDAPPSQGSNGNSVGRYVLYLGRKDAGKNVPLLLNAFRRFRAVRPNTELRLLLAGNGVADLRGQHDAMVEDLGLVAEDKKAELLRDCAALFQPSQNESFSRVMMEAWMNGKPVAAHSACLATAVAVERSGGGWLAGSEEEWAGLFAGVGSAGERDLMALGEKGRNYARKFADWDKVMERYESALTRTLPVRQTGRSTNAGVQINQFLPNLSYGDAISNYAIWIRDQLRELGYGSELYVRYVDPRVARECRIFAPEVLQDSHAAIYHHSVGSEITPHVMEFQRPKCLVYHNITPAEFFAPFRPDYAPVLQRGRDDLRDLAGHFPRSCGVSPFNARELEEYGFERPFVLPIPLDPQKWKITPDAALMAQLQDGRTNILFVGRIAPNKKQEDLLAAFGEYLHLDPDARLILVGKPEENDPYAVHLEDVVAELELRQAVTFTGSLADSQLAAYYRTAHLYWSMSEHEGFCVPLIEAMWFDIPVLAFRSSAIPETLGDAGLMFTEKTDYQQLAVLARILVSDHALRREIIAAQRKQRAKYLPSGISRLVAELAATLAAKGS